MVPEYDPDREMVTVLLETHDRGTSALVGKDGQTEHFHLA